MLSEREYVHILDKWLEGVPSEVKFWNTYMASRGATGSHNWEEVISADRPFRLEEDLERAATRFLDAGSGPFSRCGFKTSRTALSFVAVDALAPAYARLKQMYGIVSGMQPQFGFTEILSDIFPPESFDIVHMSNSLILCLGCTTSFMFVRRGARSSCAMRKTKARQRIMTACTSGTSAWKKAVL